MAALVPLIVEELEADGLAAELAAAAEMDGFIDREVLGEIMAEEEEAEAAAAEAGEGIKEGAEVTARESAEIAGPARVLWQDVKAFTEWAGKQIIQFEALDIGMKIAEQAVTKESREDDSLWYLYPLIHMMRLLNNSLTKMDLVVKDWMDWAHRHQDNKEPFDRIQTQGTSLLRFEVFQYRLRDISDFRNKTLASEARIASKSQDDDKLGYYKGLRETIRGYYIRVARMRTFIQANEAMVQAGLPEHDKKIGIAKEALFKALAIGKE